MVLLWVCRCCVGMLYCCGCVGACVHVCVFCVWCFVVGVWVCCTVVGGCVCVHVSFGVYVGGCVSCFVVGL